MNDLREQRRDRGEDASRRSRQRERHGRRETGERRDDRRRDEGRRETEDERRERLVRSAFVAERPFG
ncbi:hypothetical protein AQI88_03480 [Streptomyces cellostaticus]|uniref:Uncharacterized protein n=2 Tax=Streptomyces TaxID=1883 RepID=A0A101NS98_9ACTN|nr:hypothetical protein [Streptomyces cellostaticus]KUM98443.1 hypothetical protein AQI88_03480 [Streptomyces cellostaticus]GHI02820.1 hypothetical protein Scel_11410 [Streptomyces cellostaticus]